MENRITVATFTYPMEAQMAKAKLELEGIDAFLKDELTVQMNFLYSDAIGGVKLQVNPKDFDIAQRILVESGDISEPVRKPNKLLIRMNNLTSKFPLIGKAKFELRLLILTVILLAVIIVPLQLFSLPSTTEKLTAQNWCVERMVYKGKELTPQTVGLRLSSRDCSETMYFSRDGTANFPGINSIVEIGRWKFKNDLLIISEWQNSPDYVLNDDLSISDVNSEKSLFCGVYKLEIDNKQIKIQSDKLTIYGRKIY